MAQVVERQPNKYEALSANQVKQLSEPYESGISACLTLLLCLGRQDQMKILKGRNAKNYFFFFLFIFAFIQLFPWALVLTCNQLISPCYCAQWRGTFPNTAG
jgi:hypothetical protein